MKQKNTQMKLDPRPELSQFEPYQGGLSIDQLKRQYGLKKILKLASNENPLGTSPHALAAYKEAAGHIFRYPESNSFDLRQVVADKLPLDMAEVIIGAGSDEIIELLAKAYLRPHDEIVVSASSFIQYKRAGKLMGARVLETPMKGLQHDLIGMAKSATEKTKLVFIANPNNPTGTYSTKDEVEAFLSVLPDHVLPVFDEAYFEYAEGNADYPSLIETFFRKRPMMVLRTFSKIYGLAGLRVGYGAGPDWCIEALDKIRPPFNVSVPAQAAAQAALDDGNHIKKSLDLNNKEKEVLVKEITNLGFTVIPSAGNFLLIHVHPLTGRSLFGRILQKGIITRSVDEYGLPDYLRVTVGKPAENKHFLKVLKEVSEDK